jgi:hypothetical protein
MYTQKAYWLLIGEPGGDLAKYFSVMVAISTPAE